MNTHAADPRELKARAVTRVVLTALTLLVAWTITATTVGVLRGVFADLRERQAAEAPHNP